MLNPRSQRFSHIVFSLELCFTFKSTAHFEMIFVYSMRFRFRFFFACECPVGLYYLLRGLSLLLWIASSTFVKNQLSVWIYFWVCFVPLVFYTYPFTHYHRVSLLRQSGFPSLYSFLIIFQLPLTYFILFLNCFLIHLPFHINFRRILSVSMKKICRDLERNWVSPIDHFGGNWQLYWLCLVLVHTDICHSI